MSDIKKFSPTLEIIQSFLEKARRRMDDPWAHTETPDYADRDEDTTLDEDQDVDSDTEDGEDDAADAFLRERDPEWQRQHRSQTWENEDEVAPKSDDATEAPAVDPADLTGDDADAYLQTHDPSRQPQEGEDVDVSDLAPASPPAKPEKKTPAAPAAPVVRRKAAPAPSEPTAPAVQQGEGMRRELLRPKPVGGASDTDDPMQPTREELIELRQWTRPWEQRARDKSHLEASPEVNPVKHHRGRIVEARNLAAADWQKAYAEFTNSDEYKNADRRTKMKLNAKFHTDWHSQNPEHLSSALQAHADAHKKGLEARSLFEQAKEDKIQHILSGGVQADTSSMEEGIQHVGGSHEEDEAPSGVSQDRGAQFAMGNAEFLEQYKKRRASKASAGGQVDADDFANETRANPASILGEDITQNPEARTKLNAFAERYFKHIERAKKGVISKLGLQQTGIDDTLMNEAGLHALYQSINDYDHDHVSQAKFTTHLNKKLHGLMQTALKGQLSEVPEEMRAGAKKFDEQKRAKNAAPIKVTNAKGETQWVSPVKGEGGQRQVLSTDPNWKPPAPAAAPEPAAAPAAPAPVTAPKPAPVATAPVVRRKAADIVGAHPPAIQDRYRRIVSKKNFGEEEE